MELISAFNASIAFAQSNLLAAWIVLIAAFALLAKCADVFVDSSVHVAEKFRIPKLVIGIILVSLATTAPELAVSMMSALSGQPQMALGNAIGSVICDDGLALAFAGLVATAPIVVIPRVLKTSGIFLIFIEVLAFLFILFDYTLDRWEGIILVVLFVSYMVFLFIQQNRGTLEEHSEDDLHPKPHAPLIKIIFIFAISLLGIIISSKYIIVSATHIAHSFRIPETIIALTIVAFGTSIPEVATCIVAARKKEGALAVGNIIGADIMNICWVAGASAIANPLTLTRKETFFMFPAMFVIVGAMLLLIRYKYTLTRLKGVVLLSLYLIYMYLTVFVMKFSLNSH